MIKICDTHNDFLTELSLIEIIKYAKFCKDNGIKKICASFFSSKMQETELVKQLTTKSNILKTCGKEFLLHIEDLWWVKSQIDLDFLLKIKPFSCSLTWNNDNALAGGTNGKNTLSDWGKFCINQLIKNRIIIDLAHLNKKSFYAVAKLLKNNLYCSHTGFYEVKKHKRNLTDKQIDLIVRSNGFIGLFFFDLCIAKDKSKIFCIEDIVENLKYFKYRWGCNNIGFGTDYFGIECYPKNLQSYKEFGNLQKALLKEGFSTIEIENIFYKNFEKWLNKCTN